MATMKPTSKRVGKVGRAPSLFTDDRRSKLSRKAETDLFTERRILNFNRTFDSREILSLNSVMFSKPLMPISTLFRSTCWPWSQDNLISQPVCFRMQKTITKQAESPDQATSIATSHRKFYIPLKISTSLK